MSNANSEPVLRISNLTKRFGNHTAVNDASFEIYEGDVFGFLGPNGAGKSTTLYMIAGLVKPTSGNIQIFGQRHTNIEVVRRHTGFLIEIPAFYEYLSGRKNLEVLARLQGGIDRKWIDECLDRVGLLARAGDRLGNYSHGMKQRLGIAQALLNKPKLLLLDEPTNGLDPDGSRQIWELLRRLVTEERMTVLISSHLLHEVEEGCNRIAVINQGVIVACDHVSRLLFFSKEDCLLLFDSPEIRTRAEALLRARDGVEIVASTDGQDNAPAASPAGSAPPAAHPEDNAIMVRIQQGLTTAVLEEMVAHSCTPRAVIPQRKTLMQFFLELTRRQPERAPLK